MRASTLIIHGTWASLALAAFLIGRAPDRKEDGGTSMEEAGIRETSRSALPASWTSGPGDSPATFTARMNRVLAEGDEDLRKEQSVALISELTPQVWQGLTDEMIPRLLELFEAGGFTNTWHKQEAFFEAWARIDPAAAFAQTLDGKNRRLGANDYGRAAVIREWARSDLPALQDAVLGTEDKGHRKNLAWHLMKHLSETDLDAAIAFSAQYENAGGDRETGTGFLIHNLLDERGVAGVQQWFDEIDFGEKTSGYKREAFEAIVTSRVRDERIIELLAASENQPFLDAKLLRTAAAWNAIKSGESIDGDTYRKKTRDRLDWLVTLPPEVGPQRETIGKQFEYYLKQDFKAASEWLVGQELGPAHDEALGVFVRSATMDDVPTAMRWAERISDPQLRAETISFVRAREGK